MAKGLAAVRHLPLVGITTLDILAAGQPYYQGNALVVVIEAGRDRIIAATYRWSKGHWANRGEPQLMDWELLFASIDGPAYLTGDVSPLGREVLESAQQQDIPVKLIPAVYRLRRAGFLAEEALARLDEGKNNYDPAKLAPVYIKTKDSP
jgi:tRNA A37 threonylcarbamoyladenosine modification protein TsaB